MAHSMLAEDVPDYEATHGSSDQTYVLVAIFLAVMTGLEVATSYAEKSMGHIYVPVLLILMVIKFFTVALYFMHLKNDPKMCRRVFFAGLCVATLVYIAALSTFHFWATGYR